MKLTQHVQNIFPTLKTSPQKGIRIQTKPKTGEKHFHTQARSFAMIHWCFPYDVNYCAGFQSFSLVWVFSSFWVSFGLWYCMEMRHFNGKSKPCEHTAVMRWVCGRGLVWLGRGLSGATQGRRSLTLSVYLEWPAVKHWVHFSRWCWRSLPVAQ